MSDNPLKHSLWSLYWLRVKGHLMDEEEEEEEEKLAGLQSGYTVYMRPLSTEKEKL